MGLYPGSTDSEHPAKIYGPLPIHGDGSVALVLHTTETTGMPGFNHGDTAPHYVYDATRRRWTMFAEFEEGYVGTMKGHSVGHTNCKAFQVEILAYSSDGHDPWVGDFTDDQYRDLAAFYRWAMERYGIGADVTPTPAGGWMYGAGSPLRMSWEKWRTFSGLTAHGAVPGQTHWDTGVLDLQRIHDLALENDMDYRDVHNVPDADWARAVIDWGIDSGVIITTDDHEDDWEDDDLSMGRLWTLLYRQR